MKFDNDFKEVKIRNIISMFLVTFLILITITMMINPTGDISNTTLNSLVLIMETLCVIMLIYMIKPSKENINRLYRDFKSKLNIKEIIFVIIFFTCLNIGAENIIIDIIYVISPSFANGFINDSAFIINSMTDYWICFFIVVILTPFADEMIFRNVLFKRLSKKSNAYVGLIVSSIFFSAFNNSPEVIGFFFLGIINCILYVKYENILIPMLIYFINNFLYMLISILFVKVENKELILTSSDIVLDAILSVILITIGIILFAKFINQNRIYLRKFNDKIKSVEAN